MKTKILVTLFLVVFFTTAFGQSLLQKGKTAYDEKQYEVTLEHLTEIINNNNKLTLYSDKKIAQIYYLRASSMYQLNKNDSLIKNDLENSIKFSFSFEVLEFYSKISTETSSEILKYIDANGNRKNEYFYFIKSLVYAKSNSISSRNESFKYLEKALELGYKDIAVLAKNSETFILINADKYNSLLVSYEIESSIQDVYIKNYVEKRINQWQNKGKFEKSSDYQKRVNEVSRNKQIDYFVQYYIDSIGSQQISLKDAKNEYDADNEVFKIVFSDLNTIYLPVPIDEAIVFDRNFSNLLYTNSKFTLFNDKFELLHLDIVNPINDKIYAYDSKDVAAFNSSQLALNFDEINIELDDNTPNTIVNEGVNKITVGKSDVDINIPKAQISRKSTYALIIGNEDYKSYQTDLTAEQNVQFAVNDAEVFSEYCTSTLGIPKEHIIFETNIGVVRMKQAFNQINSIIKNLNGDAEIIIYYAGHGFPDETTKEPFLIPVDVSSNSLELAVNLKDLYGQLTSYPSKRVLIFLDACFTGGGRELGLLASRGVKIKPKENVLLGNLIVFSASSENQSALPYYEKGHGMFTYYLLKKLQETEGDVTLKELDEYLHKNISIKSSLLNNREQNPHTNISNTIISKWSEWKL